MDQALRSLVRSRAGDVCEYCRKPLRGSHASTSSMSSLASTVVRPNRTTWRWRAAFATSTRDRTSPVLILKADSLCPYFIHAETFWTEHFTWQGTVVVGRTATGRATMQLLSMNDWQRVEVRDNLQSLGEPFAG